ALISLTATWCRQTGSPCELVTSPAGRGLGYHAQFADWNLAHHVCPGPVRLRQLLDVVIPGAAAVLAGLPPAPTPIVAPPPARPVAPAFPLPAGHWYGPPDADPRNHSGFYALTDRVGITQWQGQMRARGWAIDVDGQFGPRTATVTWAFQAEKGLAVDGRVGPVTWAAAWTAALT
uniref:peptidoglycan-binding domain-containing protein n=1 Tax=Frankia sp. Cr1 TaxID=3073931 RepID=UPI002AD232AC